jgi:hypothetical protein
MRKSVGASFGRSERSCEGERALHEREREHHEDADAERHDRAERAGARMCERGERMPEPVREAFARNAREPVQEKRRDPARRSATARSASELQREERGAGLQRRCRRRGEEQPEHRGDRNAREGKGLGVAAEDAGRRHASGRQERGQREDGREREAQEHAAQNARGLPGGDPAGGHEVAEDHRQDGEHRRAERRAYEAAEEREEERLAQKKREHLPGTEAEAREHGEGVQPAREPGPHRLRDADAAHEQREERDEAQVLVDPRDAVAEVGLALGVRLDAVFEDAVRRGLQRRDEPLEVLARSRRRELEQRLPHDTASEGFEARAVEAFLGDEDARAERERPADAVGLGRDGGAMRKRRRRSRGPRRRGARGATGPRGPRRRCPS